MPQLFQLKGSDYGAVPNGPAVAIIFQESDKAQKVVGRYLITFSIPSVTMQPVQHEIPIDEFVYDYLKQHGFRAVEMALQPDPISQQYQGEWEAVQFRLRAVDAKLAGLVMGSPQWQQVFFVEKMPLMNQAYQIELTAAAAGTPIQKQGK